VVAGATGLVGREILARLLADKTYSTVHCVGRRSPFAPTRGTNVSSLPPEGAVFPGGGPSEKLRVHLTDALSAFHAPAVDDVFIALGTTIKVAGSQQAFRAVDFDAVVALATSARAAGARRIGIVSAMGADAKSVVFYNRVKGEMEDAVSQLGYDSTVFARPSVLAGDREALDQPSRRGEKLALVAMALFKPLVPHNYRVIAAADVAAALVNAIKAGKPGRQVLLSGEMQPN
jgi:uncharacterized protein YbjT (DUF2867 family)